MVRRLLQLEAARLNLPIGSSNVTQRVTVGDGGQDGSFELDVPTDLETRLPKGKSLLQLKTNGELATLKSTLKAELKEAPRPKELLEEGGSYIFVWSGDPTDQEIDEIRDAIVEVVGEDHRDRIVVWARGVVEELCNANAAILTEFGLIPQLGVLPFKQWAVGEDRVIPRYIPDDERRGAIEQIRKAVLEGRDPVILHVQGDAGVGKTRLVRRGS